MLLAMLFIGSGVAVAAAQTAFERACGDLIRSKGRQTDAQRLHALFKLHWDYLMREFPESATQLGYPGQDHRWTDWSLAAIERRKGELRVTALALNSIDRANLKASDQLNYDLFRHQLDEALEAARFPEEYLALNQLEGVQKDAIRILTLAPRATAKDYENLLARLNSLDGLVAQTIELLKRGLETGVTPPRITLRDVPEQVKNVLVEEPGASPFLTPFGELPASIPAGEGERLRQQASEALKTKVLPAFGALHEFLAGNYLPGARESIAAHELPDGPRWYEFNVRRATTTRLTPREIHELGLREVQRIRGEMEKVVAQTGFKGTLAEFNQFLRTDPRFFFERAEDLLTAYRDICKRADAELPRLFGTLPRLSYGVAPVPAHAEKSETTGRYQPGSLAAGRAGNFLANTYNLKARPKWEMEALTLHEAVPGHHLQIALAQELESLPEFRRHASVTTFVEGWALYAESLGEEMGFYKDPYAKYGQLTYEMWRAIRLVVDTGMHALGWSRQQAIDYFKQNAGKTEHDIVVEVDRYIVWPGQALAYKIGELKIKELRSTAQAELREAFNLRAFHDEVLRHGAVPLAVLEAQVKGWINDRRAVWLRQSRGR
jgi:uncharacterized protein (DUF885 family)